MKCNVVPGQKREEPWVGQNIKVGIKKNNNSKLIETMIFQEPFKSIATFSSLGTDLELPLTK